MSPGAASALIAASAAAGAPPSASSILDTLPAGVFTCDPAGRTTYFNRHAAEHWGVAPGGRPAEFAFAGWIPVGATVASSDASPLVAALQGGRSLRALELHRKREGGATAGVSVSLEVVRDANGTITGAVGVFHALASIVAEPTERRDAELALLRTEERLRLATRTGKVGLWDWEIGPNQITWTESLYEIHGVRPGEFDGTVEAFTALIHPEDRVPVQRAIQSSIDHDARYELEFRAVRPNGTTVWLFTNAQVVREAGKPVRMVGVTIDITARKGAELALRTSESRFRLLASLAPVGIFLTDQNGEWVFVNEAMCAMAGLPIDQLRGPRWQNALHPDDRARVVNAWQACLRERRPFGSEFRFLRPDNSVLWLEVAAVESLSVKNVLQGHVGTAVDITNRRVAENRLRARESQLRLIATNAPIMLAHCDVDARFLFVNRPYASRFDLKPEDIIGRTIADVLGTEAVAELQPYIDRVLLGESLEFELEVPYRRIGPRFMRVCYVPDAGNDGNVRGWLSAISDITPRRQMENALRDREEQFRMLADNIAQMAWTTDAKGRREWVNRRFYDFSGLTPEEVAAGAGMAMHHPDHLERVVAKFKQQIALGEPWEDVFPLRGKDGVYRWFLSRATPIRDASGAVIRWFGTNTDVTELRAAEEALRKSEENLKRRTHSLGLLNRMGAILAAEHDLAKIVQCVADTGREVSGAAFAAFLYTAEDGSSQSTARAPIALSGMGQDDLHLITVSVASLIINHAFREPVMLRIDDVSKDPRYNHSTSPFLVAPQRLPVRSYLAVPVISRAGDLIGGLFFGHPDVNTFTDEAATTIAGIAAQAAIAVDNANLYRALSRELSEKSAAEEELQVAQEQLRVHAVNLEQIVEDRTKSLREAIVQMEEFSYSVSHDLRAPLRAMNAYAEALIEEYGDKFDDTARNYLSRIRRSSQRMENLTHDVLMYSRVSRADAALVELNLETVLRDLIDQYSELQSGSADVIIQTPLHRVRGHESSVGQCIGNLLTNAAKFVASGVRPRIRVWTEEAGPNIRLWVEDNGIGIPPEYHARVFQVFERAPTQHEYDGTGIGLAIVRKSAEKMGGRCGVESTGQSGSRFWIELPRA